MKSPLKYQYTIGWVTTLIFIAKWMIWYYTRSISVFSDAMEGCINMVAMAFSWYSVHFATLPKDKTHPYGHGKIEFIASMFEGVLCMLAGIGLLWQASVALFEPTISHHLDKSIWALAFIALVQWGVSSYYFKIAKAQNYITLRANTQHMKVDAYTTIVLTGGLWITDMTAQWYADGIIAMLLSAMMMYHGYKILRVGVGGIMDESDEKLLKEIVFFLQTQRPSEWVDLHNFRIIKYGSILHIDAHLTLPWYWNLEKAHDALQHFTDLIRKRYGNQVEIFAHTDPCLPSSCLICSLDGCAHRKCAFVKRVGWTMQNIVQNKKHTLDEEVQLFNRIKK